MTVVWGLLVALSLIAVIGAQNAHVMRQGLRADRVGLVIAVCAVSDIVLIVAGTAGLGQLVTAHPVFLRGATWLGVAVLGWYAVAAVRRIWRPQALPVDGVAVQEVSTPRLVGVTAALTWLNPHVYLDTVVLLGSLAAGYGPDRWWFALGAGLGSVVWFLLLGFGARLLRPAFTRTVTWQIFDAVVAVVMVVTATNLVLGVS